MSKILRGKIKGFQGSWGSGLGSLVMEDEDGDTILVPCENAQTVRTLEAAFGNVISPGHSVDPAGGHVGREIYYSMDDFGLLLAWTPVEEAGEELRKAYQEGRE